MESSDLGKIILQVKTNCDISDAKFWGTYSLCGLLLRLRDQFRKEQGLMLWEHIPNEEVARWIAEREQMWREKETLDYVPIAIDGTEFSPFAAEEINASLKQTGSLYAAGLGENLKPSFFIAALLSRMRIEGVDVYLTGDEVVRDLSVYPAMLLNNIVIVRREAIALTLWQKFEEVGQKRVAGALSYAFAQYGMLGPEKPSRDLYSKILIISDSEVDSYIHHEIGEAYEGSRLGKWWKEMIAHAPSRRIEFFLRGVKDILADTSEKGTLQAIIRSGRKGSLGFYLSSLAGFRHSLFPEIRNAFTVFVRTSEWDEIERARTAGYARAERIASRFLSVFKAETPEVFYLTLEKEFINADPNGL